MEEQLEIWELGPAYRRADGAMVQKVTCEDGSWFYSTEMQATGPDGRPMGGVHLKIEAGTAREAFDKLDAQREEIASGLKQRILQEQMGRVLNTPVTDQEAKRFKLNGR